LKSARRHSGAASASAAAVLWTPDVPAKKRPRRVAEEACVTEVYLSKKEPVDPYSFDNAYLERLGAGDSVTETHFVSYFSRLLRIKLRGRTLSPQLIEDICQETFLRVLQAVRAGDAIHSPERLGAFVNSVCRNVLLESYRDRLRTQQVDMETLDLPDGRTDLERSLLLKESKKVVGEVLAKLSERDRNCLRALFLEDRDKDDICQQFGVERGYLRVLLHRAKISFRAQYKANRPSERIVQRIGRS